MCDLTESWQFYVAETTAPIMSDEEIEFRYSQYERFDLRRRFLFELYAAYPAECWAKYAHERWGNFP
jgi:predicted transcriptional regulator with HTH domain